jgi:hypothetical protein
LSRLCGLTFDPSCERTAFDVGRIPVRVFREGVQFREAGRSPAPHSEGSRTPAFRDSPRHRVERPWPRSSQFRSRRRVQQEWRYVGRGKTRDSPGMRLARAPANGEPERPVRSRTRMMRVPPGTNISMASRLPIVLAMPSARFITSVPSSTFARETRLTRKGSLDPG